MYTYLDCDHMGMHSLYNVVRPIIYSATSAVRIDQNCQNVHESKPEGIQL